MCLHIRKPDLLRGITVPDGCVTAVQRGVCREKELWHTWGYSDFGCRDFSVFFIVDDVTIRVLTSGKCLGGGCDAAEMGFRGS